MSEERKTNPPKLTYEELEKSRNEWKSLASMLTKYLSIMESKDANPDVLVSDLVTISQWNAKHIDEIAELKQALTGRTVSCGSCNAMAKERDEARAMMVTLCHKVAAAALSEEKEDNK